ncbi:hypothetical protein ACOSP7_011983 [Xanthoceras sorbifolium]
MYQCWSNKLLFLNLLPKQSIVLWHLLPQRLIEFFPCNFQWELFESCLYLNAALASIGKKSLGTISPGTFSLLKREAEHKSHLFGFHFQPPYLLTSQTLFEPFTQIPNIT